MGVDHNLFTSIILMLKLFFSRFSQITPKRHHRRTDSTKQLLTCKFRLVTFIRASSTNVIIQSVYQEKHYTVSETKYLKFTSTRKIIESNPYHVLLQEKKDIVFILFSKPCFACTQIVCAKKWLIKEVGKMLPNL